MSQLAVMLMPNTPMEELFRSFPSPEGWGGHSLAPDLAVHGVLKDKDAALFVEYDGDWRHGKNEGMERDDRKNEALLAYAPSGSFIVRISHTRKTRFRDNILWVSVDTWSRGDDGSLLKRLRTILRQFLWHSESRLQPRTSRVLRTWVQSNSNMLSMEGKNFASTAAAEAAGNTLEEIISFLTTEGFTAKEIQHLQTHRILYGRSIEKRLQPTIRWLGNIGLTSTEVTKLLTTLPILDRSVEQGLHPKRQWLLDLGFSTTEAKKIILKHPQMLGCSIEENLKPTRQWLLDLGFSTTEANKVILQFPSILGCSIEKNLKPTRQWLLDLGLSTTQAKKVILIKPQIFGYSIKQSLKPTRQWLLDLGFSTTEAKKIILKHPPILGYSIEKNLEYKMCLLKSLMVAQKLVDWVARYPKIFSYSYKRLKQRLGILFAANRSEEFIQGLIVNDEDFRSRYMDGPMALDAVPS